MDADAKTRMSESKPDPFVGRTFDGFRIEEIIGAGGMGTVYKATQLSLGRPVAIKVLTADLAEDKQFLERFHREADVLSRLSHPNIVTVFERGEIDDQPYLVMEFVEGTSLRDLLKKGRFEPQEALRIVSSVLSALRHAHEKGVIHRDIKPENVLMARGEVIKVADFGLSRLLDIDQTRLTRTHLVLGTYEYMAPEQREKAREADARADLYATGVVLYEMLSGELPIGRFNMPSAFRPECDSRVDALIDRSLDKDPDERYQNASEMADAVSAILERPSSPEHEVEQGSRRRPGGPLQGKAYRPVRFEYHCDNLATIDHVLGTVCYVLGFLALFGAGFTRNFWGVHFILFFVGGWYLRETSGNLRKFKPAARTAQAVIGVVAALTGFLLPFTIYSFWVLFGHRGRTYYEARSRGLGPREAAAYTYRLLEEPVGRPMPPPPPPAATAPEPPRSPVAPTPSQIPVESMVVSGVREEPATPAGPPRISGFTKAGFWICGLSLASLGISIASDEVLDMDIWGVPIGIGCALAAIGFCHALFWRRTARGAPLAASIIAVSIFGGVLYEEEYAGPLKRRMWERAQTYNTEFRLGSYRREPPAGFESKFFDDIGRVAWIQEASNYHGDLKFDIDLERRGAALWVEFPDKFVRERRYNVGDLICAMRDVVKSELGEGFIATRFYTPSHMYKKFLEKNPLPAKSR
ncbi:MAG: serine/threonine-protein kinase [Planctomycetota bacterium]